MKKSNLAIANEFLRKLNYDDALDYYVRATNDLPYLIDVISKNLSFVKPIEFGHSLLAKYHGLLLNSDANNVANNAIVFNRNYRTIGINNKQCKFSIENIEYKRFSLSFAVLVKNNLYPGMPVRFSVEVDGELRSVYLCKNTLQNEEYEYFCSVELVISPKEESQYIKIYDDFGNLVCSFVPISYLTFQVHHFKKFEKLDVQNSDHKIIGNVERVTARAVSGWAVNTDSKNPVELCLYINDAAYAVLQTSIYRSDVYDKFHGNEYAGFYFEIPPTFNDILSQKIEVRPTLGLNYIRNNAAYKSPNITDGDKTAELPFSDAYHLKSNCEVLGLNKISVIILNLNGSDLLSDMFESILSFCKTDVELIVVDHNSEDDSGVLCEKYKTRGLNVKFIKRDSNYNFSESNNFGARFATGEILIFANNDLIFIDDAFERLSISFNDPSVGVVGVRLIDYSESDGPIYKNVTQHSGVYFESNLIDGWFRPYEARFGDQKKNKLEDISSVPVVTGAFFAMLRDDFFAIEGFDERYNYGLEDVDLCLRSLSLLKKVNICRNDISVIHHRGFSRNKTDSSAFKRRLNNSIFTKKWGSYLRENIKDNYFKKLGYWAGKVPTIGFVVTDSGAFTSAGEYFTAKEFADALQKKISINVKFITADNWLDLSGIDILVVMVNRFDLHKVKNASPYLITVNWTRQWFDRWANDSTIYSYDYVFASSKRAAEYLNNETGIEVDVLPIASNVDVFSAGVFKSEYACDYVFTGSKFGVSREVEFCLKPDAINGIGRIYGFNWDGTEFEKISCGPVAYADLPNIYASSKVVIDDANLATKSWGSCNSRVFDSLASGCLLITNGALGVSEMFGDLVPTFNDEKTLSDAVNYWLANDDERINRIKLLQNLVFNEHSYENRANYFIQKLSKSSIKKSISIKCPAKYSERNQWGDYHFANSLADSFRKIGYKVRVDCREAWDCGISNADDIVIVLRGLVRYKPKSHQINLLWLISHPDLVTLEELSEYNKCFVASERHADQLSEISGVQVECLLQAVDAKRFKFHSEVERKQKLLFVGNSRGVFRESVKWAIEAGLSIDVYGAGWESFIDKKLIKGLYAPNEILSELYSSYSLVLCDHWADMKRLGFVSNRLFDVLASGGVVLTDYVHGIENIFAEDVLTYVDKDDFLKIINKYSEVSVSDRKRASDLILSEHSFDTRAEKLNVNIINYLNLMGSL
jgi:GT2 family glycosyltransferase/spore maturation protein CgeB